MIKQSTMKRNYYSVYMFVEDIKVIFSTKLNTSVLNALWLKVIGFTFSFYSFVDAHPFLVMFFLWFPSLVVPKVVVNSFFCWVLLGGILYGLNTQTNLFVFYEKIFEGKTSFRYSCKTFNHFIVICVISLQCVLLKLLFGCDLLFFANLLSSCYTATAEILWYTPLKFLCFQFSLFSVLILANLCYLVRYSYKYSSKTWVFVFNSLHFLVYFCWSLLIDYTTVATYLGLEKDIIVFGTGLYVVVWILCLIFSVRLHSGSWESITSYYKKKEGEKVKSLKPFTLLSGFKTIHEARLLHHEAGANNTPAYNYHYIIIMVHLYALCGWLVNYFVLVNFVLVFLCMVFGWVIGLFPLIIANNCLTFVILLVLHILSCDVTWYTHFKQANGKYVLANLGWNMLKTAGLRVFKVGVPVAVVSGTIGFGLGFSIKDPVDLSLEENPTGKWVKIKNKVEYLEKGPQLQTEVSFAPVWPFTKESRVVTIKQRVPFTFSDVPSGLRHIIVNKELPPALKEWRETGEYPLKVYVSVALQGENPDKEELSIPTSGLESLFPPADANSGLKSLFPAADPTSITSDTPRPQEVIVLPNPATVGFDPSSTVGGVSIYTEEAEDPDPSSTVGGVSIFTEEGDE